MKAFMTQEEKISNKALLDVWTTKTQVKAFMLEKQRNLNKQVKKADFTNLIDEFTSARGSEIASAVQLNAKPMQNML